ncbi:MAG: helix-turn-helix transcriptional regulator [Phycisphaerales bacterium]|nr:helix-turn-helix transcriptional regulator [Phycisphaerales bacterium]
MGISTRPIRPDDFGVFAQIPGIAAVARDQDLRLFWCTKAFVKVAGTVDSSEDIHGTTLNEILPMGAAKERTLIHQRVMETGESTSHYQFSADARVLCTVFPLDEDAFGHKGVFAIVKDAPVNTRLCEFHDIDVLSTPNLLRLGVLSSRELEILHYVATGMSTHEIAELVCRADKTIEHHVNSIHGKLGTHSRAQLVRFASERGIQSFTAEEWASIVRGARMVKRHGPAAGEIEAKDAASGVLLHSDRTSA